MLRFFCSCISHQYFTWIVRLPQSHSFDCACKYCRKNTRPLIFFWQRLTYMSFLLLSIAREERLSLLSVKVVLFFEIEWFMGARTPPPPQHTHTHTFFLHAILALLRSSFGKQKSCVVLISLIHDIWERQKHVFLLLHLSKHCRFDSLVIQMLFSIPLDIMFVVIEYNNYGVTWPFSFLFFWNMACESYISILWFQNLMRECGIWKMSSSLLKVMNMMKVISKRP